MIYTRVWHSLPSQFALAVCPLLFVQIHHILLSNHLVSVSAWFLLPVLNFDKIKLNKLKSQSVWSGWLKQESILGHSVYCPQITRSWFFLFLSLLPGSLLKPFKCISDLKVICTQSWGYIDALWALRSAKVSLQQPHSSGQYAVNTL